MATTAADENMDEMTAEGKAEDMGFAKAILLGSAIGIAIMMAIMGLTMKVFAPDAITGTAAAVAVWTGLWAGLLLGGTVSVGMWAHKRHTAGH